MVRVGSLGWLAGQEDRSDAAAAPGDWVCAVSGTPGLTTRAEVRNAVDWLPAPLERMLVGRRAYVTSTYLIAVRMTLS